MTCTKSESDNLIKPRGVILKITIPEVYNPKDYELPNSTEYVSPTDVLNPENDSGSSDIHEDYLINVMTDLVIEEDSPAKVQLETTEVLEDVGTVESDDDSVFN